jgi:uncharacterized membrane protein
MERYAERLSVGAPTRVALIRHPLHPMLVTFPIAFLVSVVASDVAYLALGDPFWARASLWLCGAGVAMGVAAGFAGTVELLVVRRIRRRLASWEHFVAAVMALAVATANWLSRIGAAEAAVYPWGVYLSALGLLSVAGAGWLGGGLVFEHRVGVHDEDEA